MLKYNIVIRLTLFYSTTFFYGLVFSHRGHFVFTMFILVTENTNANNFFLFSLGATALIWALAYLHETLRFTSVF
jgi:hypothetical protein